MSTRRSLRLDLLKGKIPEAIAKAFNRSSRVQRFEGLGEGFGGLGHRPLVVGVAGFNPDINVS